MKPTPSFLPEKPAVLAFGAHPDDIEFGCGGVIAQETRAGRAVHLVVCSRGEAGTHGQAEQRVAEARLARFGGVRELTGSPPHRIAQLLFYASTRGAEPDNISPVLIDISSPEIIAAWVAAMEAHASQTSARNYVEEQLTRARLHGLGAGVEYATALFPADPLIFSSLSGLVRESRGG